MRTLILFSLFLAFFSFGRPAKAGEENWTIRVLPNGQVVSPGNHASALSRAAGPSGQKGVLSRPAGDSDPEMQKLWSEIVHTPSCNSVLVLCEPRLGKIKAGGDRLAKYLISQYELSEAAQEGSGDSYLRFVGATGESGKSYLLERASRPETMQIGLEGLLFAEDLRAVDKAAWVISQRNPQLPNVLAVNVMRLNMITSGVIRPGDVAFLRRLEEDKAFDLRGYASRALKDLEARGLIVPDERYPHPEDLKMWVPNPVKYD